MAAVCERALPPGVVRVPQPQPREGMMPSTVNIHSWKSLARHIGKFRYLDFLVKLTPAISLAFIVYIVFKGVFL
jgi:hypothetical protein